MMMEFIEDGIWTHADPNFDTANSSNDKYFGIMYERDASGKAINLIIVNSEIDFELAKDLIIYKETTS